MRKIYHETCLEGKEVDPRDVQDYYDMGWKDRLEDITIPNYKPEIVEPNETIAITISDNEEVSTTIHASNVEKIINTTPPILEINHKKRGRPKKNGFL